MCWVLFTPLGAYAAMTPTRRGRPPRPGQQSVTDVEGRKLYVEKAAEEELARREKEK